MELKKVDRIPIVSVFCFSCIGHLINLQIFKMSSSMSIREHTFMTSTRKGVGGSWIWSRSCRFFWFYLFFIFADEGVDVIIVWPLIK